MDVPTTHYTPCDVPGFLAAVLPLPESHERFELRAKTHTGAVSRGFFRSAGAVPAQVSKLRDADDIWFGVALRDDKGKGGKDNVTRFQCVWADVDDKCFLGGKDEARRVIQEFAMPPSIIVRTAHGFHLYWLLDVPHDRNDIALASSVMRGIDATLSTKAAVKLDRVADISRVLRLPGTLNHKEKPPLPVEIDKLDTGIRYRLQDFVDQGIYEIDLTHVPSGSVSKGNRPGDIYNQRTTWPEVLEPHGWTFSHEQSGVSHWCRPEKEKSQGIGATTNYGGSDLLHVFTSSTSFEASHNYDRFTAYAVLNHEGDLSAAAKDLQAQGYRSAEPSGLNSLNSLISYPDSGKWPRLHPDALYGLAGEFVRAIEPHTEADPAALLGNTLVRFGSLAGRGAHARVEGDDHYLNENVVIVGESSKARKDTAGGRIRRMYEQIDPDWTTSCQVSGLASGEGLMYAVRDEVGGMKQGQFQVVDPGVQDKRVLVTESEFASVLKVAAREGSTLSPIIRQAWDHGNLRDLTKNNPLRATGAHISIIGHITKDELRRYLTETEAGNGFANRYLWAMARRSKILPEGGGDPDLSTLMPTLAKAVQFAQQHQEIPRDDDARALWAQVYPALSEGRPGLYGAVTSRAEAHVLRLSVMYAALDESEFVRVPHLKAALAFWSYCDASARYIFGEATGDDVADRILRALRMAPDGLNNTDLHKSFSNNVKASRIDLALTALEHQGRIRRETTKPNGRTVDTWRLSDTNSTNFTNLAVPNIPAVSPLPEEPSHSTLSQDRPSAKAMESKLDTDLTSDETRGVTPEAWRLLRKDEGIPAYVTLKLARIAQENGIPVAASTTPNEIVDLLGRKESRLGIDLTRV